MEPFTSRDLLPAAVRPFAALVDAAAGLAALRRLYAGTSGASDFPAAALESLNIGIACDADDLARLPASGPLVVVANHPQGAADGLALIAALARVRSDVKLLGNQLLMRIPEMREHIVAVDAFRAGGARNAAAVRDSVEWVRQGHVLVVFPAGEVAHVTSTDARIVDPPWKNGAARIAEHADAPVMPAFIEGRNSRLFRAAGRLHPALRTALLARELLRLRGSSLRVHLGRPISPRRLTAIGAAPARTAYLRVRCYGLEPGRVSAPGGTLRLFRSARIQEPIAPPAAPEDLAAEVAALPPGSRLLESGPWSVYCVEQRQAPLVLDEIGRLRELTFRGAGEGTGLARDLDAYDSRYQHLFVWHHERRSIAGAYRVAATDRVGGSRGLYTRSLFRYSQRLLDELGPALELGRSFVAPQFQRDYQPLLLLWRGIGRLIAREPRYRRLFGPVSISADYGAMTRQILARFLLANRYSPLGAMVRPKHPLHTSAADAPDALMRSTVAGRLQDVEEIVRELEAGQRGIPVLLRQYLKLNARLLGFSVDPSFGHVLDGLVVVDLLDVDRALLNRYLGEDGAAAFRAFHEPARAARPALPAMGKPVGAEVSA